MSTLFDEIATFARVAETGSLTSAAHALGVPKSTVSRAVSRLEDALRVRLLERSTRAVTLTAAGRRFFAETAPHVAGLADAARGVAEEQDQVRGTLRLSAPPGAGGALLSGMLTAFATRYPLIQVRVDMSARLVDVGREGFDAAIRATVRVRDPGLVARKLLAAESQLFAAPEYLARRGAPRTPEELSAHECVLFRPEVEPQTWALRGPDGECEVAVTGRVGCNDYALVRGVARAGLGIALLPAIEAAGDVAAGELVRVLPQWSRTAGALYLVYPAGRHLPRRVAVFRDFVLEWFLPAAAPAVPRVATRPRVRATP